LFSTGAQFLERFDLEQRKRDAQRHATCPQLFNSYWVIINATVSGVTRTALVTAKVLNPIDQLTPFVIWSAGEVDRETLAREDDVDLHYQLVSAPDGEYHVFVPAPNSYRGIAPRPSATISDAPPGTYRYRTTFDLQRYDPESAFIVGGFTTLGE